MIGAIKNFIVTTIAMLVWLLATVVAVTLVSVFAGMGTCFLAHRSSVIFGFYWHTAPLPRQLYLDARAFVAPMFLRRRSLLPDLP